MSHRRAANAPAATASERERHRRRVLSLLVLSASLSPAGMGCAPTLVDERSERGEESEETLDVEASPARRGAGELASSAEEREPDGPQPDDQPEDRVEAIEGTPEPSEEEPEPVPLTAADLNLGPNWELAPHPITVSNVAKGDPEQTLSDEELLQQAEEDPAWRAADGERYEALIVLEDGTSFGRRGPAPTAPTPDASNNFFNPNPEPVPEEPAPDLNPQKQILCGDLVCDRRTRVSSTTTLSGYPERTIGALNEVTLAGFSRCTGTKIGPRAVITAAHCVMEENGTIINSPGYFHPGQTDDEHPNGAAIRHSGVFLRDFRGGRREFDYAIVWLNDSQAMYNLGHLWAEWYDNAASYDGKNARLLGYPLKATYPTQLWSLCLASPLANHHCDGWMYRDSNDLSIVSFLSTNQLRYDIDATGGQSGSSVITKTNGTWTILGIHWGYTNDWNRAARFRQSMWDDVCSMIAYVPSAYGSHPGCN